MVKMTKENPDKEGTMIEKEVDEADDKENDVN